IWEEHFEDAGASGPKPKMAFKHQLRVVILDLYVAWLEDPELSIGVSMSVNSWNTGSRYNALHISKRIVPIIQRLHVVGLIDLAAGRNISPGHRDNRTTRIRAAEPLIEWFERQEVPRDEIIQAAGQEVIILRGEGEDRLLEYEDTDETNRMREDLRAYNEVIAGAFIDIPDLAEPKVDRAPTDHHHKVTRRIFSRGRWDLNGRYYGGWWQQIDSDWRSRIFINDTPTVEVDFRGLHIAILNAQENEEDEGDPYLLPDGAVPDVPAALQRKLIKRLVLTAINAREKGSAFRSFRDSFPAGHFAKAMTNLGLELLLGMFLIEHPHLAPSLFADVGIRLMYLDSLIAERVHRHFIAQGVPVLSVHDSFIIDYTRVGELKNLMAQASEEVVGRPLETTGRVGLDEVIADPIFPVDDFIEHWQRERSDGYQRRLAAHEERTGREVVPFTLQREGLP
ncbi:hypothetical protein R3X27_25475, partial [Tropicimonas sp. TH_r6]|uniref:hypothetical protein n=1 Tax=Tropicimonas sp. TH_r6 TaxID=3082085 RepID=UPI002955A60E